MGRIKSVRDLPSSIQKKVEALPPAESMAGGRGLWEGSGPNADMRSASDLLSVVKSFNNTRFLGVVRDTNARFDRVLVLRSTSFDAKGIARETGFEVRRIDDEKGIWVVEGEKLKTASLRARAIKLAYDKPHLRAHLLPLLAEDSD